MEARLRTAFAPERLDIIDDSDKHRGHAGHTGAGESHFTVHIVASRFEGTSRVDRSRLVYDALGDLIAPDRIHALSIDAKPPG